MEGDCKNRNIISEVSLVKIAFIIAGKEIMLKEKSS